MSISIGDIAYCHFSGRHGGKHFGVVIEVLSESRVKIARGTTWRPAETGYDSRWLPSSLLVDDDELEGAGLHHATRFDVQDAENFRIGVGDFHLRGRLPENDDMFARFRAAVLGLSRRP